MSNLYTLNDIYTNGYQSNILNIISVLSILCGISVIIAKNPIVSVLFLIGLFFSIASYLMALGLNFIGLSYLLVYVGAVSILFLFILMLINIRISELITDNNNSLILALILGLFILTPIYSKGIYYYNARISYYSDLGSNIESYENSLNFEPWQLVQDFIHSLDNMYALSFNNAQTNTDDIYFVTSKIWDGGLAEASHITSIGNIIYTNYPLWLILTSIILLLAMVGAIVITIKQ